MTRSQQARVGLHVAGPYAEELLHFSFSMVYDRSWQWRETGEEMCWGLLNAWKLCLVWEATKGWTLRLRSGGVLSWYCQVPADLEKKDAARNISCSEQNPFVISTRTVTEKWKIVLSSQISYLPFLPPLKCCPWILASLASNHLGGLRQHSPFGWRKRSPRVNKGWISTSPFEDLALHVTVGVARCLVVRNKSGSFCFFWFLTGAELFEIFGLI